HSSLETTLILIKMQICLLYLITHLITVTPQIKCMVTLLFIMIYMLTTICTSTMYQVTPTTTHPPVKVTQLPQIAILSLPLKNIQKDTLICLRLAPTSFHNPQIHFSQYPVTFFPQHMLPQHILFIRHMMLHFAMAKLLHPSLLNPKCNTFLNHIYIIHNSQKFNILHLLTYLKSESGM
ncbi:unnamed protein product, partial [Meganyctiphanes norvegica]